MFLLEKILVNVLLLDLFLTFINFNKHFSLCVFPLDLLVRSFILSSAPPAAVSVAYDDDDDVHVLWCLLSLNTPENLCQDIRGYKYIRTHLHFYVHVCL